jgi:hypothetical protein
MNYEPIPLQADAALDLALDAVAPQISKWAVVIVVDGSKEAPTFEAFEYRQSGRKQDFWPASCIKLYPLIATLERFAKRGVSLDSVIQFEHQENGRWILDSARTLSEMMSETFRRSSNEDYTLFLRVLGIDALHTEFLTAERGYSKSALMRGYSGSARPWAYILKEPQRITVIDTQGKRDSWEHTWSGKSYAEERGATVIDSKTGNVTTAQELAETLRRILYHEALPEADRFQLTPEMLKLLRHGGGGLFGLETKNPDSGPSAWKNGADTIFPRARFFHKCGLISNFALETAAIDDFADSGKRYLLVPVIQAGLATKPTDGEALIGQMSRVIAEWVRGR